ncbi:hypothetical protein, partial [Methanoregula sp.]|uniref:hypothetical protein n=1 Tax=Methanoregula sp. TaxID=2052170 RepID=UPI000CC6F36E
MLYAQQSNGSRTPLLFIGACVLLALACVPVMADEGPAGSSPEPAGIRVIGDDTTRGPLHLAAAGDSASTAAPDLL